MLAYRFRPNPLVSQHTKKILSDFAIILVHFCRTILDVLTTKQLLTHSSCWCDLRLYNVHDVSRLFEYSSNLQAMFCPVMIFIGVLKSEIWHRYDNINQFYEYSSKLGNCFHFQVMLLYRDPLHNNILHWRHLYCPVRV